MQKGPVSPAIPVGGNPNWFSTLMEDNVCDLHELLDSASSIDPWRLRLMFQDGPWKEFGPMNLCESAVRCNAVRCVRVIVRLYVARNFDVRPLHSGWRAVAMKFEQSSGKDRASIKLIKAFADGLADVCEVSGTLIRLVPCADTPMANRYQMRAFVKRRFSPNEWRCPWENKFVRLASKCVIDLLSEDCDGFSKRVAELRSHVSCSSDPQRAMGSFQGFSRMLVTVSCAGMLPEALRCSAAVFAQVHRGSMNIAEFIRELIEVFCDRSHPTARSTALDAALEESIATACSTLEANEEVLVQLINGEHSWFEPLSKQARNGLVAGLALIQREGISQAAPVAVVHPIAGGEARQASRL